MDTLGVELGQTWVHKESKARYVVTGFLEAIRADAEWHGPCVRYKRRSGTEEFACTLTAFLERMEQVACERAEWAKDLPAGGV